LGVWREDWPGGENMKTVYTRGANLAGACLLRITGGALSGFRLSYEFSSVESGGCGEDESIGPGKVYFFAGVYGLFTARLSYQWRGFLSFILFFTRLLVQFQTRANGGLLINTDVETSPKERMNTQMGPLRFTRCCVKKHQKARTISKKQSVPRMDAVRTRSLERILAPCLSRPAKKKTVVPPARPVVFYQRGNPRPRNSAAGGRSPTETGRRTPQIEVCRPEAME